MKSDLSAVRATALYPGAAVHWGDITEVGQKDLWTMDSGSSTRIESDGSSRLRPAP
ncbi:MAG: hypothetical protein OER43_05410 [Gammaproteobacteria bacterium]|nr:hypothetical protein [Gammaproteobacteria bacterium]